MGAQLAILNGGRAVWTHVGGLRDKEKNRPMMRLAEQHRVHLDQPVVRMLPRPLNEYEPYRESATALVLDPQWEQVTPRILLSHSSGLANLVLTSCSLSSKKRCTNRWTCRCSAIFSRPFA